MNISKSINICLDETGMMKKKLAERLEVTPQTVSTLMKSEGCSNEMLEKLANTFHMKVSEFVALGE